ncbi:TolC family protein [Sphingomonas sp.]|uniref:TolC family protein n=1 Tax=Sphingomonas sp. TaxID=28214 RepID=UPI002DD68892|nr:TolC family protein [Sphingomonas sp.]
MKIVLAAMLAAASCAGIAQAQTPPPTAAGDVLTLDQALAEAGSPGAAIAEAGVRAAQAGRTIAGLRPNPTLNVEAENVLGTGPYRGLDESETTVGFALPFELGGKRPARIAVSNAELIRAETQQAIAAQDLRLAVTQTYVRSIAADRHLAVAESQVGVTTENLRVAHDRVMVGANSPIDQQRAQLQQLNAQAELEQARRAADAARMALARFIGRTLAQPLDGAWFDRAASHGPQPAASAEGTLSPAVARADVAAAEARVRLARSQRVPDLTLSAGTRRIGATNDRAMVFGVSVPLPVFNNGRAGVAQAIAERDRADAQRRMTLFEAEREIAQAVADRDRAAVAARSSRPSLDAAIEAARIARIGYGEGKFDQMVLLDTERTLLDTRRAAIDALASYHEAEARLARLTAPAPMPAARGN